MSKQYKVEMSVTYNGVITVEADSPEEAEELASEGFSSWLSTDDGELDFFESIAEVIDSDEDDE